jgi:hypothetical protein
VTRRDQSLREQPCERDLRWRSLLPLRERIQPLDNREIRRAILGREARDDVGADKTSSANLVKTSHRF